MSVFQCPATKLLIYRARFLFKPLAKLELLNIQIYFANKYFWRTKDQTEIDYLEEYDGNWHCYEFKWNPTAKASFPPSFANAYSNSTFEIIHRDNFEKFLGID